MDSVTILKAIRQFPPTKYIPVIVYSGTATEEEKPAFYAAGANAFIRKEPDFGDVAKFLGKCGWISPKK